MGIKNVEVITENPIEDQEEIRENSKQRSKEIMARILEIVVSILRH